MNRFLPTLIGAILLVLPWCAAAEDDAIKAAVSVSISDEGPLWTGQQVTLNLDLKSTGFSFSNIHFNLPDIDGAFLMQTDTTTIKMTERIAGETWQIVSYPLALYPQIAGVLEIPSIDVRFTSAAGFGSTPKAFELQSEPLEVPIKLPPGVKTGDLVVTTASFELDHSWRPEATTLQSGDAVTLEVSRSAGDVSAMLLPPLPVFRAEGLAAYPQAPEVTDRTDRGDLTGVRKDSIIWVIEKPGQYEIPGIRFQWWDPLKSELQQQVVPGLSLDVPAPEGQDSHVEPAAPSDQHSGYTKALTWLILGALLIVSAWVLFKRKSSGTVLEDEATAFARVQKACAANDRAKAYAAIHAWLNFYPSPSLAMTGAVTLDAFARNINDDQLAIELEKLQQAVISPASKWQGAGLNGLLKKLRQQNVRQNTVQSGSRLAPLNP